MLDLYGWARYVTDSGVKVTTRYRPILKSWVCVVPGCCARSCTPEPDGAFRHYLERIDPKAYNGDAGRSCHVAMASRWHHRDEKNGQLRQTFERWQDYRPLLES